MLRGTRTLAPAAAELPAALELATELAAAALAAEELAAIDKNRKHIVRRATEM